jgi:asparagine synthase (glutamine-hydrolysing)
MCGIVGYIGQAVDSTQLSGALEMLQQRGPDASGTWASPDSRVALGHTRLAIIDLSEAGAQPMQDEATGNVVVFNGEIYNHPELRRELEQLGVAFRGHSDTETLLHGYTVWGTSLFPRLRGMFAFAIYNARSREVVLCRDRLGIKPLYIATTKKGATVFASEVRALLPWVSARISNSGLAHYLQRGSCPHEELLFGGISEFPSGCWAALRPDEAVHPNRYWPSGVVADLDIDHNHSDAPREVRRLLEDAVSSHLLADVPVACFLSGGIDSSIITALAARQMGGSKLSTFSVGFAEAAFDESKFARQMADLYGTDHHVAVSESCCLAWAPTKSSAATQFSATTRWCAPSPESRTRCARSSWPPAKRATCSTTFPKTKTARCFPCGGAASGQDTSSARSGSKRPAFIETPPHHCAMPWLSFLGGKSHTTCGTLFYATRTP